jgi:hypothetical protein
MPVLTAKQERLLEERLKEIYGENYQQRIDELNADNSVKTWWCSVADDIHSRMRKIDNDRIRALNAYCQRKIPFNPKYSYSG